MGDSAFELGQNIYEIVGVGPKSFTGTEPGTMTDIFLPTMMYIGVKEADWSWVRMMVAVRPGVTAGTVQDRLGAVFDTVQRERAKGFTGRPEAVLREVLSWHVQSEGSACRDFEYAGGLSASVDGAECAGVAGAADCLVRMSRT